MQDKELAGSRGELSEAEAKRAIAAFPCYFMTYVCNFDKFNS